MEARFGSMADREAAVAMGFSRPIESSCEELARYLPGLMPMALTSTSMSPSDRPENQ